MGFVTAKRFTREDGMEGVVNLDGNGG